MDDMQAQMGAILGNPEMMQKIMAMAQSLQGSQQETPPQKETPAQPAMPNIDIGMLQKLSGFMGQSNIDNQQNLLHALGPYLSSDRVSRLEKAIRAAKMARLASGFLAGMGR